jgi:Mg-chelatase subunit ChlI
MHHLKRRTIPFTSIVGQDEMKFALILNAINHRIGGVLIRGDKGTAKSTAVRALADLLENIAVVGTMNPEEGEIRPQLLDRFGLQVSVAGIADVDQRMLIAKNAECFDLDPEVFALRFYARQEDGGCQGGSSIHAHGLLSEERQNWHGGLQGNGGRDHSLSQHQRGFGLKPTAGPSHRRQDAAMCRPLPGTVALA